MATFRPRTSSTTASAALILSLADRFRRNASMSSMAPRPERRATRTMRTRRGRGDWDMRTACGLEDACRQGRCGEGEGKGSTAVPEKAQETVMVSTEAARLQTNQRKQARMGSGHSKPALRNVQTRLNGVRETARAMRQAPVLGDFVVCPN